VAAGQSQWFYSGVEIFNLYYLSSPPQILLRPVVQLESGRLVYCMYTTCIQHAHALLGTKTPGEGGAAAAGRTILLYYYCRTQETPGAPEDTRGGQGPGGTVHTGDPKDAGRTGGHGHSGGGSGETPRGPEGTTGGIGAGRKARGVQKRCLVAQVHYTHNHQPDLGGYLWYCKIPPQPRSAVRRGILPRRP
jgi:hypothetical protein